MTQYWWVRVKPSGERQNVTKPRAVPSSSRGAAEQEGVNAGQDGGGYSESDSSESDTEPAASEGGEGAAAAEEGAVKGEVDLGAVAATPPPVVTTAASATAAAPAAAAPAEENKEETAGAAAVAASTAAAAKAKRRRSSVSAMDARVRNGDPRVYVLTAEDVGCRLKVKCRPMRSDCVQGAVHTSLPFGVIV